MPKKKIDPKQPSILSFFSPRVEVEVEVQPLPKLSQIESLYWWGQPESKRPTNWDSGFT